ncbi:MAG TPA: glycosyltransferase family 2 protein [Paucimonas sp.]|nr:glycosyltransferase family 2 protein [Paucimonas sp.]
MALTFSIITCTWNSGALLDASIASVLAQDYPHIEYIFVDGGSDDGTLERIHALRRPFKLIKNVRGGISNAMNAGLRAAGGDVVAYLHSDDYYLHPRVLSEVARHFENRACRWLFGRIRQDIGGRLQAERFVAPRYSYARLLRRNFIPHPAAFVERALMLRAGGFDTGLKYAMDYDLWLKLGRLAAPLQLDEPLAAFRVHAGSLSTRNRLAAMEEDFRVRLAHAGANPLALGMHYARYLARRRRLHHAETPA